MASVPVTGSAPPPTDSRYGDAAHGPLFRTPAAMERFRRSESTHTLSGGYLLWILAPFTLLTAGAHRFYYGKPLTGLLWSLTFGLLGVGWVVDFFLMPRLEAQADRRYTPGPYDYNLTWILNAIPFLGIFGVHRFYLGKWVTGLIWFFTLGLFGFGWIWDLCTLNEQVDSRNRAALGGQAKREGEGVMGVGW
ncbi:TM2 domain-containing protein [Alienimonas californiensis]|uniref:TM2 domain protein n=1 Tax=Alienimonas californiensis TaxID=2527989 RepID=A0A517PEL2_9PLAN|nr:TM2 domain-containing protein [Alienimonas californiensis]QDT17805.1 TM2 domain protein [Alienimonas californiensis]